jgi:ribosomal protein S27E
MIPKPRSNFLSCGEPLAEKGGSKANIVGKILGTLDQ